MALSDDVADRLREARRRAGLNREQLAGRCGEAGCPSITAAVLTNIETGRRDKAGVRRRMISVDELTALAQALDLDPVAVLGIRSGSETAAVVRIPADVPPQGIDVRLNLVIRVDRPADK